MLEEIVRNEVQKAVEVAREAYPQCTIHMPIIKFSNRMTRSGGSCGFDGYTGKYTIKFSVPIMEQNDIALYSSQVPWHEVAHMVDRIVYGGWGHGATFYRVLRGTFGKTGREGKRYHTFKTPAKRKMTKHVWKCQGCGEAFYMSPKKHKRYSLYHGKAYCVDCGADEGTIYDTGRIVKK